MVIDCMSIVTELLLLSLCLPIVYSVCPGGCLIDPRDSLHCAVCEWTVTDKMTNLVVALCGNYCYNSVAASEGIYQNLCSGPYFPEEGQWHLKVITLLTSGLSCDNGMT